MCTNNKQRINKNIIGWKLITADNYSIYQNYKWKIGYNKVSFYRKNNYTTHNVTCDSVFHCFATREHARLLKNYYNNKSYYKIIKVVLSKNVYVGIHDMFGPINGKKAHCGSHAYWDGKYHY